MRVRSSAVRRYASFCSIICLLLPFVSVKECKTETVTRYSGYEMILRDGGWIYLVPAVAALIIFSASFVKREWSNHFAGFSAAGACVLSGLSFCAVVFYPELQFLFDEVRPLIGQLASSLCWALLYVSCAVSAVVIIRSRSMRRLETNPPRVRLLPWTIILSVCGAGLFLAPGIMLAHDSAKEWIPAFAAVTFFISVPGFAMLFFIRGAIADGLKWGRVLAVASAAAFAAVAALMVWSKTGG